MPQRFAIAVAAPEHQNDLAGWIGAEPTGEAEQTESGWFDWLPGLASGVTDFISSEGGQEVIKAGTKLYVTREQREAAEKEAAAQQQASTMQELLKLQQQQQIRPPTQTTYPSQPTVIVPQQKTNWVMPVAIGVGALVLLGGGFLLMKKKK